MKKPRTAKQLANDERLRNRKVKQPEVNQPETNDSDPRIDELLARIKQLENRGFDQPAQVTARGIIGTVEKYAVDPTLYTNPIDRLSDDPRLVQFAFKSNYEMEWKVDISSYETKDGINMKEPKFSLQLNRIRYDDDGNDTGQRIVVRRIVMHEDPQTALLMARQNGVQVDESNEINFLNEMRYLRFKEWLMEIFYPKKGTTGKRKRQEVIGGNLVEVFETATTEDQLLPFRDIAG